MYLSDSWKRNSVLNRQWWIVFYSLTWRYISNDSLNYLFMFACLKLQMSGQGGRAELNTVSLQEKCRTAYQRVLVFVIEMITLLIFLSTDQNVFNNITYYHHLIHWELIIWVLWKWAAAERKSTEKGVFTSIPDGVVPTESTLRFLRGPMAASAVRLASLCLIWASSCCCIWRRQNTHCCCSPEFNLLSCTQAEGVFLTSR